MFSTKRSRWGSEHAAALRILSDSPLGSLDDDIVSKRCKEENVTGVVRIQRDRNAEGMPEVPGAPGRRFVGRFPDGGKPTQCASIGDLPVAMVIAGVEFTTLGSGSNGKKWSPPSIKDGVFPNGFQQHRLLYTCEDVDFEEEAMLYRFLVDPSDEKSAKPYFVLSFSVKSEHRTLTGPVCVENQVSGASVPDLSTSSSSSSSSSGGDFLSSLDFEESLVSSDSEGLSF